VGQVIISAISEPFLEKELNMIASVQYWEPSTKIVVWLLDGSDRSRKKLESVCNVEVSSGNLEFHEKSHSQLRKMFKNPC
jgi:hypothetical protein